MRHYEAMYIVDPDVPDEEIDNVLEKYKKVVTDAGGNVTEAARWERGRRPLAYEIRKKREGIYLIMQFETATDAPQELDRIFRINDEVMRHIIQRTDEDEE